jgi:hypothetical protein
MRDDYGFFTPDTQAVPIFITVEGGEQFLSTFRTAVPAPSISRNQLSGAFTCSPSADECVGVREITWTFPVAIWGLAGFLEARTTSEVGMDPLPGVEAVRGGQFPYRGFYAIVFDTPTDTLTLSWRATDDGYSFRLAPSEVAAPAGTIIPVPEPASALLLGLGMVALTGARRRSRPA